MDGAYLEMGAGVRNISPAYKVFTTRNLIPLHRAEQGELLGWLGTTES